MEQLLKKHPDLKDILKNNPELKTYKQLTESGRIKECWEKNDEGHWVDVTVREKLKEKIAIEKEELESLKGE